MAKQLVVRLRADGTVDAETIGMHGPECLDHIEALEALLDAETVSSRFTEDYTTASVQSTTAIETEQSDGLR
ncbi:DUF2997 domain-containing protein [Microbacterium ureisolvens]|uniref:DUF2997 domain-containing protein n=1 Tax=Microbacterium TaxID=33882 RepID=UPI000D64192B|nr:MULTISPECIES: DUF2997 domain-containing protein [Microbacterium]